MLVKHTGHFIDRHCYLPADWRSFIRWSPEQWVSLVPSSVIEASIVLCSASLWLVVFNVQSACALNTRYTAICICVNQHSTTFYSAPIITPPPASWWLILFKSLVSVQSFFPYMNISINCKSLFRVIVNLFSYFKPLHFLTGCWIYRVIQKELPPLTELNSDILSKKCHINLGPILHIYGVTFVVENALLWNARGLH
jgi:hypothetical protein